MDKQTLDEIKAIRKILIARAEYYILKAAGTVEAKPYWQGHHDEAVSLIVKLDDLLVNSE